MAYQRTKQRITITSCLVGILVAGIPLLGVASDRRGGAPQLSADASEGAIIILRRVTYRPAPRLLPREVHLGPIHAQVRTSPRREVLAAVENTGEGQSGITTRTDIGQIPLPGELLTDSETGLISTGTSSISTGFDLSITGLRALDARNGETDSGTAGSQARDLVTAPASLGLAGITGGSIQRATGGIQRMTTGLGGTVRSALQRGLAQ